MQRNQARKSMGLRVKMCVLVLILPLTNFENLVKTFNVLKIFMYSSIKKGELH